MWLCCSLILNIWSILILESAEWNGSQKLNVVFSNCSTGSLFSLTVLCILVLVWWCNKKLTLKGSSKFQAMSHSVWFGRRNMLRHIHLKDRVCSFSLLTLKQRGCSALFTLSDRYSKIINLFRCLIVGEGLYAKTARQF